MECTNRLAFAQLCIEEYFERQNILNPVSMGMHDLIYCHKLEQIFEF